MVDSNAVPFFGGVPTDPDIRLLRETYPVDGLAVGRIIPYHEVATVIIAREDSCRFKTVTNRWRKMMEKEFGIVIGAERKIGFKVLAPRERVDLATGHLRSSCRQAVRAMKRSADVPRDKLTQEERRQADHTQTVSAAILSHGRLLARQEKPKMTEINK